MRDSTMIAREIAPLHFVVCGAPSYLKQHGTPRRPADLARHNCLRLQSRTTPGRTANWLMGPDRIPVSPPVSGNLLAGDVTTLVLAAVHGQGLAFAPLPFVLPLFRSGALVPVLGECISRPAHLFVHYPNRKHLPVRVRSFVDFMLDRLRKNPDLVLDAQTLIAPYVRARQSKGK